MIRSDETFNGTFPYPAKFSDAAGFQMHYIDEGPRDGRVVLCLHGEPTWGYLFRHLIAALSGTYHVVVPDHMGFGKSATPHDRSYWVQDHIDNLERFVLALDLREITLVVHDFGGPVGMGLAARHPHRIRSIISTNGPVSSGQASSVERLAANAQVSPWFQWIIKAESEGRLENVLGELGFNILSTLKLNGFENHALIDDIWLRAYGARFVTPADAAGVIGWAKGVALGAHRFETLDAETVREIQSKPAMAIWGMADRTLHAEHFLPLFSELFPQAPIYKLAGAGHYSLEDKPEAITAYITEFLRQT